MNEFAQGMLFIWGLLIIAFVVLPAISWTYSKTPLNKWITLINKRADFADYCMMGMLLSFIVFMIVGSIVAIVGVII